MPKPRFAVLGAGSIGCHLHSHLPAAGYGPEAVSGADYVLVTVKTAGARSAAEEIAAHLSPATAVVSFQNGPHNAAPLRDALPGHRVPAGMVPYNVIQPEPGIVHQGLQRGRPTEIDPLQSGLVALAERHGHTTPANTRLTALVHEADASPRMWQGPDLYAEPTGSRSHAATTEEHG
jgi:ketopantoate reductase